MLPQRLMQVVVVGVVGVVVDAGDAAVVAGCKIFITQVYVMNAAVLGVVCCSTAGTICEPQAGDELRSNARAR